MKKPIIIWLRKDLRINDNRAIFEAAKLGAPIVPIFILDESYEWAIGGASKVWLHYSLKSLEKDFADFGIKLIIEKGNAPQTLFNIFKEINAQKIFAIRNYEPFAKQQEAELHDFLGNDFKRFGGNLLFEPEDILNKSGTPFLVFTPFFKSILGREVKRPCPTIKELEGFDYKSLKIEDLELLPQNPNWAKGFKWEIGEKFANEKLQDFIKNKIEKYKDGRDFLNIYATSLLSPHLAFGEISPRFIWHEIYKAYDDEPSENAIKFLSELCWREFSYNLLTHNPKLPHEPLNKKFAAFEWEFDEELLQAWQNGKTGYPIIDAAMRELWVTGYMHNRARMIVASFLIKDLLIHWEHGEKYFWDCLIDADLANNAASWQWVAGSGADAAPYFRIFNPITQSQKFDEKGEYIRKWLPELSRLSNKYIHAPFEAPKEELAHAGIILGKNYPLPIVDHKKARERALEIFKGLK